MALAMGPVSRRSSPKGPKLVVRALARSARFAGTCGHFDVHDALRRVVGSDSGTETLMAFAVVPGRSGPQLKRTDGTIPFTETDFAPFISREQARSTRWCHGGRLAMGIAVLHAVQLTLDSPKHVRFLLKDRRNVFRAPGPATMDSDLLVASALGYRQLPCNIRRDRFRKIQSDLPRKAGAVTGPICEVVSSACKCQKLRSGPSDRLSCDSPPGTLCKSLP